MYAMAKARIEAEQLDLAFHAPDDEAAIVRELDRLMDAELAQLPPTTSSRSAPRIWLTWSQSKESSHERNELPPILHQRHE